MRKALLGLVIIAVVYAAWIVFQPDIGVDPVIADPLKERDVEYSAAVIGLLAPQGTDSVAFGRSVLLDKSSEPLGSAIARAAAGKPLFEYDSRPEFQCWWKVMSAVDRADSVCGNILALRKIRSEYAEPLSRFYALICSRPNGAPDLWMAKPLITMHHLALLDVALDIRDGLKNEAFRKWQILASHARMRRSIAGNWYTKAIYVVGESMALEGLQLLLDHAPKVVVANRDATLDILAPSGLSAYNLHSTVIIEAASAAAAVKDSRPAFFAKPKQIQMDLTTIGRQVVGQLEVGQSDARATILRMLEQQKMFRLADLSDPIQYWDRQRLIDGLFSKELVAAMQRQEAKRRLYSLAVELRVSGKPDHAISDLLQQTPAEFRSPYDQSLPRFDPRSGELFFKEGTQDGRVAAGIGASRG
jgi:hypothetical protein